MPLPLLQGLQIAQSTAANMTQKTGKSPAPAPPSPTASFYDVSDEEEKDYSTISHTSSSKGVKLLFSKSKVRIVEHLRVPLYSHPSSGICTSLTLGERQHTGLHCSCTAEVCSFVLRTVYGRRKAKSCFSIPPGMGTRIHACRRRPQHVCQGRHGR